MYRHIYTIVSKLYTIQIQKSKVFRLDLSSRLTPTSLENYHILFFLPLYKSCVKLGAGQGLHIHQQFSKQWSELFICKDTKPYSTRLAKQEIARLYKKKLLQDSLRENCT